MLKELNDFETFCIINALTHQIRHDQKRIDHITNKYEIPTQDLAYPKQRIAAAKKLIKRLEDGKIYSFVEY